MRVFMGPPGEAEVTGGRQVVEIERHGYDDLAVAIARIGLVYVEHDRAARAGMDGVPCVSYDDLPAHLRADADPTEAAPDVDPDLARWEWVREEIAWALEQTLRGDEVIDDFTIDEGDYRFVPSGPSSFEVETRRPGRLDMDGLRAHDARWTNGMRLFAAYMSHL